MLSTAITQSIFISFRHLPYITGKDCGFPGRPTNGTTLSAEKFFYPGEEVGEFHHSCSCCSLSLSLIHNRWRLSVTTATSCLARRGGRVWKAVSGRGLFRNAVSTVVYLLNAVRETERSHIPTLLSLSFLPYQFQTMNKLTLLLLFSLSCLKERRRNKNKMDEKQSRAGLNNTSIITNLTLAEQKSKPGISTCLLVHLLSPFHGHETLSASFFPLSPPWKRERRAFLRRFIVSFPPSYKRNPVNRPRLGSKCHYRLN